MVSRRQSFRRAVLVAATLAAAPAPPLLLGAAAQGQPRGAGPLTFEDRTGFQQIFDGVSMKNWDGDPAYWKTL
jgi:hypothetical protein